MKKVKPDTYTLLVTGLTKTQAKISANAIIGMFPEKVEVDVLEGEHGFGMGNPFENPKTLKCGFTEIPHY